MFKINRFRSFSVSNLARSSVMVLSLSSSGMGLVACSQSDAPSDRHISEGTEENNPSNDTSQRKTETPSGTPAAKARPIATDSLVLTLGSIPTSVTKKGISAPETLEWLQQTVGNGVRVLGARTLDSKQLDLHQGTQIVLTLEDTEESAIRDARSKAQASAFVERAELDPIWSSNAIPNDPRYGEQWHLPKIGAPAAWDIAAGSSNVLVAVIDTGIDLSHPDLVNAIWQNPYDAKDGVDNDGNGLVDDVNGWNFFRNNDVLTDSTGHGTHLAGLIAAQRNNGIGVAGVASGVKVLPIVVSEYAPASAVVSAIYYAVDRGAHIINMSFGGPESFSGARAAIDYATERGVLLVASANNWASDEYSYPAVYQDVLAVAATDENDQRARLSSYGSWVDIAAPGQDVLSTFPVGDYLKVSGTSQAAPIVCGVAALIKSQHPDWTAEQIRTQLLGTADDLNPTNPDYFGQLGAGRVNAARAVSTTLSGPRSYVKGYLAQEVGGNGDQQLGPNETGQLSVSTHFTVGGTSASIRLDSSDPYLAITSGAVTVTPKANRTENTSFGIRVANGVPANHVAVVNVVVESAGGTTRTPLRLSIAPAYRQWTLPFAYQQNLVAHPSGKMLFVADDAGYDRNRHRVYAAFRNSDGSFSSEVTLSDTTNNARKPAVHVDANGDVHVAFYQSVQSQEFASFPGYTQYQASTNTWLPPTILTSGSGTANNIDRGIAGQAQHIAIARDPQGTLHLAWGSSQSLVLTQKTADGWGPQQIFAFPGEDLMFPQLDLRFLTVDGKLRLFVHPIPTRISTSGGPPIYDRPLQVLDYDGASWTSPVVLSNGNATEDAHMPFLWGGTVRRFHQPAGTTSAVVAELQDTFWMDQFTAQDIGNADFRTGFFGLLRADQSLLSFITRPTTTTPGSTRELWRSNTVVPLPGDVTRLAVFPKLVDAGNALHAFNQERRIHRQSGTFYEYPESTSYYTDAALASSALPTRPVVVDDGATTDNPQVLHGRWSSSHVLGIASYKVAWGTTPGEDDLVPWTTTSATEASFDLGAQRMLPGQVAYLSVVAKSNAVLSSNVGVSDGIRLIARCTAPLWNASVCYQAPGTQVTHQGATYRSLYWNSNATPGQSWAWQLVSSCVNQPIVRPCVQPAWTAGRTYNAGSRVSFSGSEYEAQWTNAQTPAGACGNPWKWVANCN
jgi:subtilisin family serine protease